MRANRKKVLLSLVMVIVIILGSFFSTYTVIAQAVDGNPISLKQGAAVQDVLDGSDEETEVSEPAEEPAKDNTEETEVSEPAEELIKDNTEQTDESKSKEEVDKVAPEAEAEKGTLPVTLTPFAGSLAGYIGIDVKDVLKDVITSVKQDGVELGDGDTIDGTKDIQIEISFKVPVEGDGGEGPFVKKGDYAKFPLSSAFDVIPAIPIPLIYDGYAVGTVSFVTEGGVTIARVDFDGNDIVFTPADGDAVSGVNGEFSANFRYNGHEGSDPWGTENVALLDKHFDVTVDTDKIDYKVTKSAETKMSEGNIGWSVTVEATKTVTVGGVEITKHIDLDGYTFVDKLNNVGEYVTDSFLVGGTPPDPTAVYDSSDADKPLKYNFASGMASPQTVTFKTQIPDSKYFASSRQSITNTAELYQGEEFRKEGSITETFTPPTWITKAGAVSGEVEGGVYNPANRLITWTIEFNHAANTLTGVKITDALPSGLTWQSAILYKESAPNTWEAVASPIWSAEPGSGIYEIGNINYKGRLIIITKVDNTDDTTTTIPFYNSVTITWDGFPAGTVGTSGITAGVRVDVGYIALTKSGTRLGAAEDRTIEWTVNFDPKGQVIGDLKIYDLLVYGKSSSFNISAVTGVPAGIIGLTPRYGQQYIDATFQAISGVSDSSLNVIPIMQGTQRVADLIEITIPSTAVISEFKFHSRVLDPDLFASNTSNNSVKVRNTATLFKSTTKLTSADATVSYNSSVLRKEMLDRAEAAKSYDSINPNNITTIASAGFNNQQKSVIFRLSVNADDLDWGDIKNGQGDPLGDVIVTDTLPEGWVFDTFSNGAQYLIYEASGKVGSSLQATTPITPLVTVGGLSANFEESNGRQIAVFTFGQLNQPYVILVKAKPDDTTLSGYLTGSTQPITKINSLTLQLPDWNGISSNRDVSINIRALKKESSTVDLPDGVVKWSVEYDPYGLVKGNKLEDTLPVGVDLRLDSSGKLLLGGNITAHEITINPDGSYTQGAAVVLIQEGANRNIWYDNQTRTLHFVIPDKEKAYRFTYLTDVTTLSEGTVSNKVKLLKVDSGEVDHQAEFVIQRKYGNATMQRTGWLQISKKNSSGESLSGATFTLYAKDSDIIIRQSTSGSDGICRIMAIPEGEYRLIETAAPPTYLPDDTVHTVKVEWLLPDGKMQTCVDGKAGINSHILTVTNYRPIDAVGRLKIQKTVAGTNGDTNQAFVFTITLNNIPNGAQYPYTGVGVPGGVIIGGTATFSLAHNQSITVTGLPAGTTYAVNENSYKSEGYHTVSSGGNGIIVAGVTQLAEFTNTRNQPGELTIGKRVEGTTFEAGKKFGFSVTFTTSVTPPTGGYDYVGYGVPNGKISSGDSIYLAHGESITIKDLPEDTVYEVKEKDYTGEGYITQSTGGKGTISAETGHTVAFTNHAPGSLSIHKTVQGNAGDRTKKFDFTVTFPELATDAKFQYIGVGVPDGSVINGGVISLAHDESITIIGLAAGTRYDVREKDYTNERYQTSSTGESGSIIAGDEKTAAFTNTKNRSSGGGGSDDSTGELTIQKKVAGKKGEQERLFTFVVTFDANGLYSYSGSRSGMISSGQKIMLAHDEQIVISGLPLGIHYEVTEKEANRDGYYTTSSNATGIISRSGEIVKFINTRAEQNPGTGDDDVVARATAGLIACSLILTFLFGVDMYFSRKNKKHEQN